MHEYNFEKFFVFVNIIKWIGYWMSNYAYILIANYINICACIMNLYKTWLYACKNKRITMCTNCKGKKMCECLPTRDAREKKVVRISVDVFLFCVKDVRSEEIYLY